MGSEMCIRDRNNSERIVLFDSLISEDELFEMAINLIESRISE